MIGQEYRIPLKQDAVPVYLYTPRRVPHPLLPKVKEKLDRMVHDNVISPVTVPTEWCSGISDKGVEADPEKTKAVREFPRPTNVKELQRFNGMVNQLAKFIPELASMNEPLRQLLRKGNQFLWDLPQEKSFREIKQKLTSPDVLAHYDSSKRSVVAPDACQDGLGAVLFQTDSSGNRRAIAFASRSLREAIHCHWERCFDSRLGIRKIQWLHPRHRIHPRDRSSTARTPIDEHRLL